ncbi:MAG: radical SAM protein [Deltaproteobacteria bacterium]|nr:radical SAM protein [Deltaproteobacteria bacterium]
MGRMLREKSYVPRQGVWEITLACNMRCRHCGSHAGRPRDDELSTDEALRALGELAAAGCERLVLSGGEPLVRRDWPRLVEEGARLGIGMKMITNGWCLDDAVARTAKDAGLAAVGISLDGLEESHDFVRRAAGAYRHALDAIRTARAAGIPVAVVTHINRRSLPELDAMHSLLSAEGIYAWQVQLGNPAGELALHRELTLEPRDLLTIIPAVARLVQMGGLRVVPADNLGYYGPHERVLRTNSRYGLPTFAGCLGGKTHFGLESNGNLKACLSLPSARHGCSDYVEGNLREASFGELWGRPGAFAFNRASRLEDLGGFCRTCEHARLCHGGCRWSATVNGGGLENPYCWYRVEAEERPRAARSRGRVAAALAAPLLLAGAAGCYDSNGPDDVSDVAADDATASEDIPVADAAYGFPDEATPGDVYGIPDVRDEATPTDAYGIPDVREDGMPMDAYGIPDEVAMPDAAYGFPDMADDGTPSGAYGFPDDADDGAPSNAYGFPDEKK